MMVESGPSAPALRQVAAAEGTSTTAIYSMFVDRAGLIREVARTAAVGFVAAQRAVAVTDDPYVDLFNFGREYRAWALAHPTLYQVLMTPTGPETHIDGPIPESAAAEPLRDVINRLIGAGIFPPYDPNMLLGIVWASVHGFVSLELAGYFSPTSQEQIEEMFEAQLSSIARGWHTTP